MINKIVKLHKYLFDEKHYMQACQVADLIKSAAADPVATNKTKRNQIPDEHFSPEDIDPDKYREKVWGLYFRDIYDVHYDRYVKLFKKKNPDASEEEIEQMALDKVNELTHKAANKAISSHQAFLNELRVLEPTEDEVIVSPGSGFAHEQVVGSPLRFSGLEYQQALVDMANQRNEQLGIPSRSTQWSFLKDFEPGSGPIGDDWESKINTIEGDSNVIYAKHACGGLTDGVVYDAVRRGVKKIFLATCCAYRYTDVSHKVLRPKDETGRLLSFDEYKAIAKDSRKQGEVGKAACNQIDDWRQQYLEENGYRVDRGETEFGPFIRAIKID